MEWAATIPVWALCLMIFVLRVCDVTLGTVPTVAIVKGYLSMAVVLGFFELVFWVLDQRACAREQWRTEAPATARTASHRLACRLQKEMMGIVREKKVVSWAT